MIRAEERRRRSSVLDGWLREAGASLLERLGGAFRVAGERAWAGAVRILAAGVLVGAAAVLLLMGSVQLLRELRLPAWLVYAILGAAGLLAGFLLWRSALPGADGRR